LFLVSHSSHRHCLWKPVPLTINGSATQRQTILAQANNPLHLKACQLYFWTINLENSGFANFRNELHCYMYCVCVPWAGNSLNCSRIILHYTPSALSWHTASFIQSSHTSLQSTSSDAEHCIWITLAGRSFFLLWNYG
jgi:hypothetical protein